MIRLASSARRFRPAIILVFGFAAVRASAAEVAAGDIPSLFPAGAAVYAELDGLGAKLAQFRSSDLFSSLLDSPQYKRYEATPDYRKLRAAVTIAERQLGADPWSIAEKLLSGQIAIGVYPKDNSPKPDALALLRVPDAAGLVDLRKQIDPFIVLAADQVQRTEMLGGVELYSLPNDFVLAWKGNWLAVATSRSLLDKALEKLNTSDKAKSTETLAEDTFYRDMAKLFNWHRPVGDAKGQRVFRVYVDTAVLRKAQGAQQLPEKLDNPLGSLLFGDVMQLLRTSPFLAATVDVTADGLALAASVPRDDTKVAEPFQAFVPNNGDGVLPLPKVPNLLSGFTLYRDFAEWYKHREDLLQADLMPGFDKFESGLANLLPGRDFGQDVLPLFGKRMTFVAAPQDYSHLNGEPGIKLPGMAIVMELSKPEEAAAVLQLFYQTIAAIANLQAGQEGRQPWVVESQSYRDVQISFAKYLEKPTGKQLGIVANFLPASARVGDQYILSSSLPLCKQLIDDAKDKAKSNTSNESSSETTLFELNFDSLADMLKSNADFFVARLAQEGRSAEEAEAEFDASLDLLRRFDSVRSSSEVSSQAYTIRLEGKWK